MDAGKTQNLPDALWDALLAARATPAHPQAATPDDDAALPRGGAVIPNVRPAGPTIDPHVDLRTVLSLGGYTVNLSAAAVAASQAPVRLARAPNPAKDDSPRAAALPAAAAQAQHSPAARLKLSIEEGILSAANIAPRAPASDGTSVPTAVPAASPDPVRLAPGPYSTAPEAPRAVAQPADAAPPAAAAAPAPRSLVDRIEPSTENGILSAPNITPRAQAAADGAPVSIATPAAPSDATVRPDVQPAHIALTAGAVATYVAAAAAEEAKAASRLAPRPSPELVQQLLGQRDGSPAPDLYRLIVGAAALGALLLLFL